MRRLATHQFVRSARAGFTIVELLMVVGILLFLIATSAFVVRNIGNKAREKATMATIVKVNGLVQDRVDAMRKALDSTKNQKYIESLINQKYTYLVNTFNGKYRSIPRPVIEILVQKDLFRQNLPQYAIENPDAADLIDGVRHGSPNVNADLSAELLYYILTNSEIYGVPPVGEDAFSTSEVADTDGDGLKEFVDGWGRPLRFYRWPTRLFNPTGNPNITTMPPGKIDRTTASIFFSGLPAIPSVSTEIDPLQIDPDDPLGRIEHENSIRTNDQLLSPLFDDGTAPSYSYPLYGTMNTFWMPLIVSAGEDGVLGLYEPNDETNYGVLGNPVPGADAGTYDNITNHNQRAGGR
ncbi:MAG: type II secretion system protein [Planctomycetaceae bacterium]|nr:type II secretion system protein [Planctomycetaceae bacterium]